MLYVNTDNEWIYSYNCYFNFTEIYDYSFSDEHRFDHGCRFENLDTGQLATFNCDSSKPLKPYLCSMDGCFISEIIRIDCQYCGLNFCMK